MVVKFRRYGDRPVDIKNFIQDKQCNCRGAFHRCRNTDLLSTLRGCKCATGRVMQLSNPCACIDTVVTSGENIARDSTFESTPLGPIPMRTYFNDWEGQLVDPITFDFIIWNSSIVWTAESDDWTISDADPDTGSKHANWTGTSPSGYLLLDQNRICLDGNRFDRSPVTPVDVEPWLHSGVAATGDFLEISIRAKGNGSIQFGIDFWRMDGSFQNEVDPIGFSSVALSGSYTTYTASGVVSASSDPLYRFRAQARATGGSTGMKVDNFSVAQL